MAADRPGLASPARPDHLRTGDTLTRLAAGFEIGVTTAWRYVRGAIGLLAKTADDLARAMNEVWLLAYRSSTAP
jgi:hypothetical protein